MSSGITTSMAVPLPGFVSSRNWPYSSLALVEPTRPKRPAAASSEKANTVVGYKASAPRPGALVSCARSIGWRWRAGRDYVERLQAMQTDQPPPAAAGGAQLR